MTSDAGEDAVLAGSDQEKHRDETKTKFRFKSKRKSDHEDRPRSSSHRDGERHHRHHHRTKRRKRSPSIAKDDPSLYDDTHLPDTSSSQYLNPDAAFRESLFDAMADDEGAQFWEGVYGQPIHTYPNLKETPEGELEKMTDEEYTAFVRAKMYEKTHQHLIEEKARRDEAKKQRERLAAEGRKEEREADRFRRKVEESLKRGEERKVRKAWGDRWDSYIRKWEDLAKGGGKASIASIPWPVDSGSWKDVDMREVERFFMNAPSSGQPTESGLSKVLKLERIRWHPDKIQQKLGGQDVDETVIRAVTEVFQIIDRIWSELRAGKG
ncbi:Nuclear factor of kappa light polypeptide [Hyphodiscus hymeniophilus]|uniref:Nuclear factor of kappa light polypeptide n=1 Tax=Hyphodiscus hymeniophilus TaxID=353542 RepID=A0A9P6VGI1_9HELO|nr:Nuclear factor of kappa light polypeptide [Hyphodiscus hymeniophilus]